MRLLLLPISTKRTLLYCIRASGGPEEKEKLADKITRKAARLWADWERKESGWQRKVVDYGNYAFRRIPYQEWGLKSVPSLSARKRQVKLSGREEVDLVFPPSIIPAQNAEQVLLTLGTEREALHKRKFTWCLIGMPITLPFALVPVIPNLPFFYLAYRAWSHRGAIKGGQHIQYLVKNKLISLSPSPLLDKIYSFGRPLYQAPASLNTQSLEAKPFPAEKPPDPNAPEELVVTREVGAQLGEALDHPEIALEVERALWQVEQSVKETESKKQA